MRSEARTGPPSLTFDHDFRRLGTVHVIFFLQFTRSPCLSRCADSDSLSLPFGSSRFSSFTLRRSFFFRHFSSELCRPQPFVNSGPRKALQQSCVPRGFSQGGGSRMVFFRRLSLSISLAAPKPAFSYLFSAFIVPRLRLPKVPGCPSFPFFFFSPCRRPPPSPDEVRLLRSFSLLFFLGF